MSEPQAILYCSKSNGRHSVEIQGNGVDIRSMFIAIASSVWKVEHAHGYTGNIREYLTDVADVISSIDMPSTAYQVNVAELKKQLDELLN